MSDRVMGIDPSLTSTGWAMGDMKGKLIDFGKIQPKELRGYQRWEYILNNLMGVCEGVLLNDDLHVFIEGYPFGIGKMAHSGRIFDLAELGGAIKYMLRDRYDVETVVIATQTAKKAATGTGRATKEFVQQELKKKYKQLEDEKSKDVTDAVAVMLAGINKLKEMEK